MRLSLLLAALLTVGCTTSSTVEDLSVIPTGCRQPSACFSTSCDCLRADVIGGTGGGIGGACLLCDPTAQKTLTCDCTLFDAGATCSEPAQVCVGRGPVCPGVGARCLQATKTIINNDGGQPEIVPSTCSDTGGDPPQMVPRADQDAGPGSEPRCAFVDDVCCPGSSPPDAGAVDASPDQSVPDLGTID